MSDEVLDTNNEAATFRERLMAFIVDNLIFIIIPGTLLKLYLPDYWDVIYNLLNDYNKFELALIYHAYEATFSFISLLLFERTPGKAILNCRVIAQDGSKANMLQLFLREYCGKYISGAIMWVGYFLIATRKDHKALHDILSDTKVVRDITNNGTTYPFNKSLLKILLAQFILATVGLKVKHDLYNQFNKTGQSFLPILLQLMAAKNDPYRIDLPKKNKNTLLKNKDIYAEEVRRLNEQRARDIEENFPQRESKSSVSGQPVNIPKDDLLSEDKWEANYKYGDMLSLDEKNDPRFADLQAKYSIKYQQDRSKYIGNAVRLMYHRDQALHLEFFEDETFVKLFAKTCTDLRQRRFIGRFYGTLTHKGKDNYIDIFKELNMFNERCLIESFKTDDAFLAGLATDAPASLPYVVKFVDKPVINDLYFKQSGEAAIKRIKNSQDQIWRLEDHELKSGELIEYILLEHTYHYPYLPPKVKVTDEVIMKMLAKVPHGARFLKDYNPTDPNIKKMIEKNLKVSLKDVGQFCREKLTAINLPNTYNWAQIQALIKVLPESFLAKGDLVFACANGMSIESSFYHALFKEKDQPQELKDLIIKENVERTKKGIPIIRFPTKDENLIKNMFPR